MLGPFAPAFLAADPRAEPFLPRAFARPPARLEAVREGGRRRAPAELIDALRAQSRTFSKSAAREANLEALAQAGSSAVVTGQQVGLFLGPLYTFHKAATAIAVARALSQETGTKCVPIFWLQTEDHDFDEIDHCAALDAEGNLCTLRLAGGGVERQSVEHRTLGAEVAALLDRLEGCVAGQPHAAEVLELFRAHYRHGASVAAAFAGVIAAVFADEGLVVLDPRDPVIARRVAPLHVTALRDAAAISEKLAARERELEAAGFEPQVRARADSPLSFFHPDGAEGPRFRLHREGDGFALAGREQTVAAAALMRAIEANPLQVSSSALLRPILQDTLLPTAALVGGPAELSYFAQLEPLYRHFEVPMPMAVPRARFRLVDARARRLLDELGLQPAQVEAPREELLRKVLGPEEGGKPEALRQELLGAVERVLGTLPRPLGPDLEDAVKLTQGTVERAASKLAGRYARALEHHHRVASQRVDRVQDMLFPEGQPQERVLGVANFAARSGWKGLKEAVFKQLEPFETAVKDVSL